MRTDITRTATLIGVVTLLAAATAAPPPRAKGAQVVGRTIDESGGGLPGVTVTVRSGAFQRQAGSKADARFDIAGVAPGVYSVTGILPIYGDQGRRRRRPGHEHHQGSASLGNGRQRRLTGQHRSDVPHRQICHRRSRFNRSAAKVRDQHHVFERQELRFHLRLGLEDVERRSSD